MTDPRNFALYMRCARRLGFNRCRSGGAVHVSRVVLAKPRQIWLPLRLEGMRRRGARKAARLP